LPRAVRYQLRTAERSSNETDCVFRGKLPENPRHGNPMALMGPLSFRKLDEALLSDCRPTITKKVRARSARLSPREPPDSMSRQIDL
jgi:hypothetical protein